MKETLEKVKAVIKTLDVAKKNKVKVEKVTIQDRIDNQVDNYTSLIDETIDAFIEGGYKKFPELKLKEKLLAAEAKTIHCKRIKEFIAPILEEIKEAKSGKDKELKEAYSNFGTKGLKKFVEFLENLNAQIDDTYSVAKVLNNKIRKPRCKKEKSPIQITAKLQYQREFEDLKSIDPCKIVGATQLWVYNTRYRYLGIYVCDNPHGLTVKGSTVKNFNAESIQKKLRKPKDIIPDVLEGGKVALRKILQKIRCKEKALSGRINKDTILLRAV